MISHQQEAGRIQSLRRAFLEGARWMQSFRGFDPPEPGDMEAARRYPMPTVEVPRVVKDPEDPRCDWRVMDGGLQAREWYKDEWMERPYTAVTPERVKMWADLIANPTERRQVDE